LIAQLKEVSPHIRTFPRFLQYIDLNCSGIYFEIAVVSTTNKLQTNKCRQYLQQITWLMLARLLVQHSVCEEIRSEQMARPLVSGHGWPGAWPCSGHARSDQAVPTLPAALDREPQVRQWLCVDECAAMVRRGYVQSYVSTRQRGEPILPPVMSAVECQKLAAKGDHRGVGPNAVKATWEPDHAIIGARGD
jgi:hypothetical protein